VKGAETIVVGGGILGATTAWELARAGMDVLLLEAKRFGEQSTGKSAAIVRKAPRSLGSHVKSLNYLDGVVAKRQATAAGMQEAIMLDHLGAVAECTGANVFLVSGGTLVTPTTRSALPGITRRTVLELAAEQGVPAEERDVWPMELYATDAVFLTGSGAGIVRVAEVDGVDTVKISGGEAR